MRLETVRTFPLILALFLGVTLPGTAQQQPQLSESLAGLVRSKWQMIEIETASANQEWAGRYRAYDGPTVTTDLAWSPVSGFIAWWENCSRPGSSRVNHGSVVFQNGSLLMSPQVSENTAGSLSVASEYVPIKWDAQHFLVPRDHVMKFIYAVNSNSISELETFLLKVEDNDQKRRGRPAVPSQYARYLGLKPINAMISRVGPETGRWFPNVFLNAGKRKGVIPEMKFYYARGNRFFVLEVVSVTEDTSEAAVVFANGEDGKRMRLRSGWRVSSRAPKGREQYMP